MASVRSVGVSGKAVKKWLLSSWMLSFAELRPAHSLAQLPRYPIVDRGPRISDMGTMEHTSTIDWSWMQCAQLARIEHSQDSHKAPQIAMQSATPS